MIIEVTDLWKDFGEGPVVRGLSFTVEAGEVHGLLGPNGAGKTTTVKCVVGLLRPDRGSIRVAGREVPDDWTYKELLGYLPENPSLPEYLTVGEFLLLMGRLKGLEPREARDRAEEVAALFGVEAHWERLIHDLSKGTRQRVAFAAAVINSPKILVLDEPFNGLDPEAQRVAKVLMRETAKAGGAVLVSTHLLDSVERLCDRATILSSGRAVASGTISEILRRAGLDEGSTLEEAFINIVRGSRGRTG
ncbi:MAG: ABC transporter ATP-binding protein [Nitrososphaerota archaeon]